MRNFSFLFLLACGGTESKDVEPDTEDTGSTEQGQIKDTTRFPANPNYYPIQSNSTAVEGNNTNSKMDFLSNGFKVKNNDGSHNTDGSTYIYIAFAENPLVTSGGVPATAR